MLQYLLHFATFCLNSCYRDRPTSDPTTNPTHAPTADPTHDPITYPVHDPTTDPSHDPTTDLSHVPTTDPTSDPTYKPTADAPFCVDIDVDVIDFTAFSSDDMRDNVSLQMEFANVTESSIAQTSSKENIDEDAFHVNYDGSSASSQYIDGELQRSLFVYLTLCTIQSDDLEALTLIIQHEGEQIADTVSDRLVALYLEGEMNNTMEVSIYISSSDSANSNNVHSTTVAVLAISIIGTSIVFLSICICCMLYRRKPKKAKEQHLQQHASVGSLEISRIDSLDSRKNTMTQMEGVQETQAKTHREGPGNESNESEEISADENDKATTTANEH